MLNSLDPYCVLGENEVQIKSSKRNFKATDGLLTDIVLGDVLVRQARLSQVIKLSSKYRSPGILAKSLQTFARYTDPDYVNLFLLIYYRR